MADIVAPGRPRGAGPSCSSSEDTEPPGKRGWKQARRPIFTRVWSTARPSPDRRIQSRFTSSRPAHGFRAATPIRATEPPNTITSARVNTNDRKNRPRSVRRRFRATAFGLGALRALHDRDVLDKVSVVSGISGGSLLTALWAYGPRRFQEFDDTVTALLRGGLQNELVRRAFAPHAALRSSFSAMHALSTRHRRSYSRTDALVEALAARSFGACRWPRSRTLAWTRSSPPPTCALVTPSGSVAP